MHFPFRRKTNRAVADDDSRPLRSDAFLSRAMDAWGDTVYRVALAQTGSPSDADDVYQDVFMRLLEHTAAFESGEHLKAWLLRVTINRCHDFARLSWNRRTGGLEQEHVDIPAPDSFRADIWEVVGALPPDLRTTVHLFYVEGYSTEEIARISECEPSTVRTRLYRARERLRASLQNEQLEQPNGPESRKESSHGRATRSPSSSHR